MGLNLWSSNRESDFYYENGNLVKSKPFPNPNSENYTINSFEQLGDYLLMNIVYKDCTNYKGRKILVFKAEAREVMEQEKIDPHFLEDKDLITPIARFEPTDEGRANAKLFIKAKNLTKYQEI